MTNTSETKTCADPSLTLGDLITVINEIRLDNGPVTTQTVIAALVARTNAKVIPDPMIALPSRSEVQSAPLAEINATPQALPAMRSYSEPVPNTRARVTTRAPIASGASQASVQTTYTQSTALASKRRKRFYAVLRGRQTGVFEQWNFVKELTVLVPNGYQQGFSTEDQAFEFYYSEKDLGNVRVIWLSMAEELQYGPHSTALF